MMIVDNQNELSFLVVKRMNLEFQLEQIVETLDAYEQYHLIEVRYGESFLLRTPDVDKATLDDYLAGDWQRKVELYKQTFDDLITIQKRILAITNEKRAD